MLHMKSRYHFAAVSKQPRCCSTVDHSDMISDSCGSVEANRNRASASASSYNSALSPVSEKHSYYDSPAHVLHVCLNSLINMSSS